MLRSVNIRQQIDIGSFLSTTEKETILIFHYAIRYTISRTQKKITGGALSLEEFLRYMNIFYRIRNVHKFVPLRTNDNISNSRESKKILLFRTESYAKMLPFENLHKLTNNSTWFFAVFEQSFYFLV